MRNQWCCEQIDNIAEKCSIHPDTVAEIKKRNEFVEEQPDLSVLSTKAIRPLIREKDPVVKEKAIEKIRNDLKGEQGAGRGHKKKLTAGDVKKVINKIRIIEKPPAPLPLGKFKTIEADPPWMLESSENKSAVNQYSLMDLGAIKKMSSEIDKLADENCHLYLWAINPMLPEAFEVMKAWGFEYKTMITWVKNNGFGTGHYFRGATEHILFGVRGKLDTLQKDQPTYFEAGRSKHSIKPDRFYEIVERMSPMPYVRLFARSKRDGWISWGNEI